MVMPYSKKDSLIELLATTIDQKGSIEVELIGTIIFQVAGTLKSLHRRFICHRSLHISTLKVKAKKG